MVKKKSSFQFVLVLTGISSISEDAENRLFKSGCSDALIRITNNIVSLDFDRNALSLKEAIISAIQDIESSGIGAMVDHVEGSLVTLSQIEKKVDYTKQALSLFVKGERGKGGFPTPVSGVGTSSLIWRWSEVAEWLLSNKKIDDPKIVENAKIVDEINFDLNNRKRGGLTGAIIG